MHFPKWPGVAWRAATAVPMGGAMALLGWHSAGLHARSSGDLNNMACCSAKDPESEVKPALYHLGERSSSSPQGATSMVIGNPDAFARKMKKFRKDGLQKLVVISDFDYTLTPYFKPNGDQARSCHGVLMSSASVDPALHTHARQLFLTYYPIEISSTLSHEEKLPYMVEWWNRSHDLLISHRLTKKQIEDSVINSDIRLRKGFDELFDLLRRKKVPALIFSAGLADVIQEVLKKEYFARRPLSVASEEQRNIHVVSNLMHFDEKGRLTKFVGKMIHCYNKNAKILVDTPFWTQWQGEERHNILLIGDSTTDASMADGMHYEKDGIIRVGFLNTKIHERLEEYLQVFDVVLLGDASLLPVEMLVSQLTSSCEASTSSSK